MHIILLYNKQPTHRCAWGKEEEIMQQEKHGCVEFLTAQTTQQISYVDGLQYQIVSERSREK